MKRKIIMAEFKDYATEDQIKAVEHRGHNILVSASAGSGKTKVLVERIKDEIIHENASISRMLIMTFTNAAAKEMKDRLTTILNDELQQQIQNHGDHLLIKHLRKQITAINVADICTIDAFCLHFLKKYYYAIDLDPNFRVLADESERDVLREDVWEEVREEFYQKYEDLECQTELSSEQQTLLKHYNDFLQIFAQDRNDEDLTNVVYRLSDFSSANANPNQWLDKAVINYEFAEDTFTQTKIWKNVLKDETQRQLQVIADNLIQYRQGFEQIQLPAMQEFYNEKEKSLSKLTNKTDSDLQQLQSIIDHLQILQQKIQTDEIAWDDLRDQIPKLEFKAKRYAKKIDFDADDVDLISSIEHLKQLKDNANQSVKNLMKNEFFYNDRQLKILLKRTQGVVTLLIKLVKDFRQRYLQVKLQRHAFEFSDLELFTLQILQGTGDIQQKIRDELTYHYTEIMLDEYQDTNGLQEAIIQSIAANNLFMVGDVKQSIYRFRQADPSLFMEKYQSFVKADTEGDVSQGELIVLQENFRSIKNIADLINMIFMQIMDQRLGEINYDQQAILKAENPAYQKIGLINNVPIKALIYLRNSNGKSEDEHNFQLDSRAQGQFTLIANEIKKLIDNQTEIFDRNQGVMRPICYSDIAILSSSHQDSLLVNEEFKRLDIPTDVEEADNYFKTTEIQIMISYLKTIDNPHQDVPLVAVLRSPMYQFDENELAYLRINHPHGDFYSALTDYSTKMNDHPDKLAAWDPEHQRILNDKVCQFNRDLATFRVQAKRSEISPLIWNIYSTTGFLDYVGGLPGGTQRKANLHALYERATMYEKTSFKGLFQFIRFVERMNKQQRDLPTMKRQDNEDTVKFMTIHKSKGLEFPVVFVTDLSKKFNMQDLNQKYILDDQLGIGLDIIESSKQTLKRDHDVEIDEDEAIEIQETTPVSLAIKKRLKQKTLAEEMRKLYVALTRAEQRLYLIGSYDNIEQWADSWGSCQRKTILLDDTRRASQTNFMNLIGMAVSRSKHFADRTFWIKCNKNAEIQKINAANSYENWGRTFNNKDIPTVLRNNKMNLEVELWDSAAVGMLHHKNIQTKALNDDMIMNIDKDANQTLNPEIKDILDFEYPHQQLVEEPAYRAVTDIKRLFDDPDNNLMDQLELANQNRITLNVDDSLDDSLHTVNHFKQPNFISTEVLVTPAQIGTATHLIFQKISLSSSVSKYQIQQLIQQLVLDGSIAKEIAVRIDIEGILAFYQTSIGQKIVANADRVYREVPFSLLLPASSLPNINDVTDQQILIHGIIDGYFIDSFSGDVYLFDYKTDHASINQIQAEYQGQLNLYSLALQQITGKEVKHKILYSVYKRQQIDL